MSERNNIHSETFISKTNIYIIIIAILLVVVCILNYRLIPICIGILVAIIVYANLSGKERNAEISEQLKDLTINVNTTAKTTLINSPFPLIIIDTEGSIIWKSEKYVTEFADLKIDEELNRLLKEIKISIENSDNKEKGSINTTSIINEKEFQVLGSFVKAKEKKNHNKTSEERYTTILYFIDNTELIKLKQKEIDDETSFGIIMIDNYEEVSQRMPSETRTILLAQVEKSIYDWAAKYDSLIIKSDRDTFYSIITKKNLIKAMEDKLEILDDIKSIDMPDAVQPTLSIAYSNDGATNIEKGDSAKAVINIALGRGGDQAIIKIDGKYDFFGGRSQEVEKRTKVKARMVSHALKELIMDSDNVIVMGHTNSDMDAIGSALGIYSLAKNLGVDSKIVVETKGVGIDSFIEEAKMDEELAECFINKVEAEEMIKEKSLLVVVDTNKKTYVDVPELLEKISRVVIIDHHRRSTDDIEEALLTFHEVYASSAAELVTEIIEYSETNIELKPAVIEALYAGIMIDTKNFTFKTGVRTFEAAAYLRRCGVDIIKVKKLFQNDLETFKIITEVISNAEIMNENIAIAIYDKEDADSNIIVAKVADELLTIGGIVASFVLGKIGDKIYISGRSVGDINVQLILEKLGGGGHITLAGAQLENIDIEDAKQELINRINEYFFEIEQ